MIGTVNRVEIWTDGPVNERIRRWCLAAEFARLEVAQGRVFNCRFSEFVFGIREPEVWQKMALEAPDLVTLYGLDRCDPSLLEVEGMGRMRDKKLRLTAHGRFI